MTDAVALPNGLAHQFGYGCLVLTGASLEDSPKIVIEIELCAPHDVYRTSGTSRGRQPVAGGNAAGFIDAEDILVDPAADVVAGFEFGFGFDATVLLGAFVPVEGGKNGEVEKFKQITENAVVRRAAEADARVPIDPVQPCLYSGWANVTGTLPKEAGVKIIAAVAERPVNPEVFA